MKIFASVILMVTFLSGCLEVAEMEEGMMGEEGMMMEEESMMEDESMMMEGG